MLGWDKWSQDGHHSDGVSYFKWNINKYHFARTSTRTSTSFGVMIIVDVHPLHLYILSHIIELGFGVDVACIWDDH